MASSRSRHILTAVGFGALAFVVTAVTGGVWTGLLAINLATSPAIPWAVVVMAGILWLLWRYLGGAWWPRSTADVRRRCLRARRVAAPLFLGAVVAGLLAIVALAGLWFVLARLARLPARVLPDYSHYPFVSVALALIMASLVGAIVEEAMFRGYFQGTLEGWIGPVGAILITALVMSPEHSLTQGFVWSVVSFYVAVDIMLGTVAYLTQSILPGIVIHTIGLLVFFSLVWPSDEIRRIVGQGSDDDWLWIHGAQTVIFAAVAIIALVFLARKTSAMRASSAKSAAR